MSNQNEAYQDLEKRITPIEEFAINKRNDFNEYQEFVRTMKVYPEKHAIVYPTMGMMGEAGEVAEKVKKWLRGDRELDKLELLKEAGDVMWYLASLADDLGYTLQDMVDENVKKLTSRKERGVQKGDGDNR
jgi:NTP pyrophosphatase (non-canonical NTP hydrolase)